MPFIYPTDQEIRTEWCKNCGGRLRLCGHIFRKYIPSPPKVV